MQIPLWNYTSKLDCTKRETLPDIALLIQQFLEIPGFRFKN